MKRKRTSNSEGRLTEAGVLAAEVARLQRQVAEAQAQLADAGAQALQRMEVLQQEVAESFAKARVGLEAHLQRIRDSVAQLGACDTPTPPRAPGPQVTHFIPTPAVPQWHRVRLSFIPEEGYLRGELALLLHLAPDGADFNALLTKLRGAGLLVEREERWLRGPSVTAASRRLTVADGFSGWGPRLSTKAHEVLTSLRAPGPASPGELAQRVGMVARGGVFNTVLKELKDYGLVGKSGRYLCLSDAFLSVYGRGVVRAPG